jgi:hypothetical protein
MSAAGEYPTFSMPRIYRAGSKLYIYRDVTDTFGVTQCQYGVFSATGQIHWFDCEEGSRHEDVQPFMVMPDDLDAPAAPVVTSEPSAKEYELREENEFLKTALRNAMNDLYELKAKTVVAPSPFEDMMVGSPIGVAPPSPPWHGGSPFTGLIPFGGIPPKSRSVAGKSLAEVYALRGGK